MHAVPGVTGYAAGSYGQVRLGGDQTPAIGIDAASGGGFVTLLRGRAPAGPDEIALGAGTLRAHGWRVGEQISASATPEPAGQRGRRRPMRIVGEVVLPSFSEGGFAATNLGQGAEIATSLLSTPTPPFCTGRQTCYAFVLIRYRPGTNLHAAARRLQAALTAHGCAPGCATITADQRPADIQDYASVQGTPLALSALLALLAIAALAHVLLTSVRRRRRDLAVLKTLGLRRAQLLAVVSWQAGAMAAAALLIGVPAGLLAGRWAWALFATSAGVSPAASIPDLAVLIAIPVTLAAAIAIAAWPGWEAAQDPAGGDPAPRLTSPAATYSARSNCAVGIRRLRRAGQSATRFAATRAAGISSSPAPNGIFVPGATPRTSANSAQAQCPAAAPTGRPISTASPVSVEICQTSNAVS